MAELLSLHPHDAGTRNHCTKQRGKSQVGPLSDTAGTVTRRTEYIKQEPQTSGIWRGLQGGQASGQANTNDTTENGVGEGGRTGHKTYRSQYKQISLAQRSPESPGCGPPSGWRTQTGRKGCSSDIAVPPRQEFPCCQFTCPVPHPNTFHSDAIISTNASNEGNMDGSSPPEIRSHLSHLPSRCPESIPITAACK